jgi:cytochrome c oxidase subunit 2
LIPNRLNEMWIDPHKVGVYFGQCAQFCEMQHAKMLSRAYVDSLEQFAEWVRGETKLAQSSEAVSEGRRIFEMTTVCINCLTVSGTVAGRRFRPDLTHLMSRDTISSGAAP